MPTWGQWRDIQDIWVLIESTFFLKSEIYSYYQRWRIIDTWFFSQSDVHSRCGSCLQHGHNFQLQQWRPCKSNCSGLQFSGSVRRWRSWHWLCDRYGFVKPRKTYISTTVKSIKSIPHLMFKILLLHVTHYNFFLRKRDALLISFSVFPNKGHM